MRLFLSALTPFLLAFPKPVFAIGEEAAGLAVTTENIVLLIHIITAVFMAWPLYALITVNERPKVAAPLGGKVDDFIEGIVRKQAGRCYVFQLVALITGLYLWSRGDFGINLGPANILMLAKLIALFILFGILSYVVFVLQPKIDRLFILLKEGKNKKAGGRLRQLRLKRKKMAARCLFVLLLIIAWAVQIRHPLSLPVNLFIAAAAAFLTGRVFKASVPYGFI